MRIVKERLSFISLGQKIVSILFLPDTHKPCPALIMCHGAMDFKENFFEFCQFLAGKGIAALAMDMHGFGESGGDRFHVVIEEWVADIRAALAALQVHRLIDEDRIGAFGFSSGGTAVLECSLIEPGIKALVTLDATVRSIAKIPELIAMEVLSAIGRIKRLLTGSSLRISLVSSCRKIEAASDPEVNSSWGKNPRVLEMWSSFPFPGIEESIVVDTIRRMNDVRVPTLVLHGGQDKIDPPDTARLLYGTLTCTKGLHIIEGNGHLGHLDRNKHTVMELTAEWALKHLS
jgi:uncharacterized protein